MRVNFQVKRESLDKTVLSCTRVGEMNSMLLRVDFDLDHAPTTHPKETLHQGLITGIRFTH